VRIFDRIASGESVIDPGVGSVSSSVNAYWRRAVNTGIRFIADEAAQHVYWSNSVDWSVEEGRFGIQMPPFDNVWIEWLTPRMRFFGDKWHDVGSSASAAHVTSRETDDGAPAVDIHYLLATSAGPLCAAPVSTHLMISPDKTQAVSDTAYDPKALEFLFPDGAPEMEMQSTEEIAAGMTLEFWPVHMALGFLNWPKVKSVTERAPEAVARKRRKRGHFEGLEYRRMVLPDFVAQSLRANRQAEQRGTRLHAVSGHFRTYTKPLGGKPGGFTGSLYIKGHWRGDKSRGVVNKEYQVRERKSK
jgi:hypothetical protein